jgi:hypothetical protein
MLKLVEKGGTSFGGAVVGNELGAELDAGFLRQDISMSLTVQTSGPIPIRVSPILP